MKPILFFSLSLGYMLEANKDLSEAQKDIRARNTFLLALDGDVDFQPDAIVKLVSRKRQQSQSKILTIFLIN